MVFVNYLEPLVIAFVSDFSCKGGDRLCFENVGFLLQELREEDVPFFQPSGDPAILTSQLFPLESAWS